MPLSGPQASLLPVCAAGLCLGETSAEAVRMCGQRAVITHAKGACRKQGSLISPHMLINNHVFYEGLDGQQNVDHLLSYCIAYRPMLELLLMSNMVQLRVSCAACSCLVGLPTHRGPYTVCLKHYIAHFSCRRFLSCTTCLVGVCS